MIISAVQMPQNEDINSLLDGHSPDVLIELLKNRVNTIEEKLSFSIEDKMKTDEKPEMNQTPSTGKLDLSNPQLITYINNNIRYRLLGGISLQHLDRMRATLQINLKNGTPLQSLRHTFDLYHSEHLHKFMRSAADQLQVGLQQIQHDMAYLIEKLENDRLARTASNQKQENTKRELTEKQRKAAIDYLSAPDLLKRTCEDIGRSGVIGEKTNRLVMYICFTSRLRQMPLHIISFGASGTGKTYLQEKVAQLIPDEDILEITMISDNALYYVEKDALKHKLILIEDLEGAENVLLTLRELMSKLRISKQVTIKDVNGKMKAGYLQVEGPVCVASTTTKEKIYEDNANRSLLIYRDGSSQQQEAIMDYQRHLSAGLVNETEQNNIKELFKDMQTVLRPLAVRNPYAPKLKIPPQVFKPLRSNAHYLQFIECITFYHQYQRPIKTDPITKQQYIQTTLEDIAYANRLLRDVLLAKADELSGACRRFLEKLKKHLNKQRKSTFFAKYVRNELRMNPNTLKYYLQQLTRYGRITMVGGNRFKTGYEYQIVDEKEYETMKNTMQNALDQVFENIKNQKNSG